MWSSGPSRTGIVAPSDACCLAPSIAHGAIAVGAASLCEGSGSGVAIVAATRARGCARPR
eukprot:6213795-Pleurochrysis_carterae.AAC.2